MRVLATFAILILVSATTASAQEHPLQPGQRVRVTAPSLGLERHNDSFRQLLGDTLVLESLSCPTTAVRRLEVYGGRRSEWLAGTIVGGFIGGALGLGAGAVGNALCNGSNGDGCGWAYAGGLAVGAAGGAFLGLFVGAAIKSDRWKEVPLEHVSVSIAPVRSGVGIGARIPF